MIRVAIVEDIKRLAEMMKEKVSLCGNNQVVWVASNGKEAIAMLNRNSEIDVLLMDINMPVMDGIQATKEIMSKYPKVKIVMSTVFDDDENIFNAVLAGASGYLLKDESADKICRAIEDAINGEVPMSAGVAQKALQLIKYGKPQGNNTSTDDMGITTREKELLENLSLGLTYNQIADKLCISTGTVRKHIENIYTKLQVHNKVEALQKAQKNKII